MKKTNLLLTLLFFTQLLQAQTLTGHYKQHAGQELSLTGFNYYKSTTLGTAKADSSGFFIINYPKGYKGMAILNAQDQANLVLALTQDSIQLKGTHLNAIDRLEYINSKENTQFLNYAQAQGVRSNALSAINYLLSLYNNRQDLATSKIFLETLTQEKERLNQQDTNFLNGLDQDSYLRWFIPLRKLVQETPVVAQTETERIPEAIAQFRTIDFNNKNFKNSGLLEGLITGHYDLLQSMEQPLDRIATQMNLSTQYLIDNLQDNDEVLNVVSSELFHYLEARSLFEASEYLSVSLLNNSQCALTDDLLAKLESYRKLKVGAYGPDIQLNGTEKLSAIKTYKLLVFGASWCPNCKNEAQELLKQYDTWQAKNIEVVYISLDTEESAFKTAYNNAPWKTFCDYQGWDTQAAKDYYISGTPSYFLLDANNKIVLRPSSVAHAKAWIAQHLK